MKKLLISTILLSLMPALAYAKSPKGGHLKRMDSNHDGKISLQEFNNGHNQRFKKPTKNNDGVITANEARHPKAKRLLKKADTNKDGQISQAEFSQFNTQRFQSIDSNNDGFLNKDEGRNSARNKRFQRLDTNQDGSISKTEFMAQRKGRKHSK